ncbi:MAG: response regulator [candidate division NC10 bacterium]|nr:response regulator [candidate division NC10 bacterium]
MSETARKEWRQELQAVVAELTRLEGEVVRFLTTFGQGLDQLRDQVQSLLAAPGSADRPAPATAARARVRPPAPVAGAEPSLPAASRVAPLDPGSDVGEAATAPVAEEGPRGRVLIIDDEAFILTVTRDILQASGFEVLTAKNGIEGIEQAQREHPDVIILDVMMSGIDGYETCRRLKKDEGTRDITVIMLTALENEKFNSKAFQAGAEWTITKSLDPAKLISTVGLAMSSHRRKGD